LPNEPAYREYLKRILKIGVQEVHADEIDFDNVMLQAEPKSCRCPRCIRAFHEFLRQRYPTKETVRRRFGLPDVEWIIPNEWDSSAQPDGLAAINDPCYRSGAFSLRVAGEICQRFVRLREEPRLQCRRALQHQGRLQLQPLLDQRHLHPLFANRIDILSFDTGGYEARIDAGTGALYPRSGRTRWPGI